MKQYLKGLANGSQSWFVYRYFVLINMVSSLIMVALSYFILKAISHGKPIEEFEISFLYLSFSSTLLMVYKTWVDYRISGDIVSGNIAVFLTKPFDYHIYMMSVSLGSTITNFSVVSIPSLLFISLFVDLPAISLGNVVFLLMALVLGFLISFHIDFLVGLTGFITESVWGLSISKDSVVMALGGVAIPYILFPENALTIVYFTPFPWLFYEPIRLLMDNSLTVLECLDVLIGQSMWVVAIVLFVRVCLNFSLRKLTVNGG